MPTKEELISENELLRRKLALAEAWMRREVALHQNSLSREGIRSSKRKQLDNMLERENLDIITRKIEGYFGPNLESAPKFTRNHLIDAEIYWQTLQKFPTLDALPVVSSYQKVLESFFERILEGFREFVKQKGANLRDTSNIVGLDGDVKNILQKKYNLSLGRWYQFFQKVREGNSFGGRYEDLLLEYISTAHEGLLEMCIVDPFFSGFEKLILLEVFGKKRHEGKMSYADAKLVRDLCMGSDKEKSILFLIARSHKLTN